MPYANGYSIDDPYLRCWQVFMLCAYEILEQGISHKL